VSGELRQIEGRRAVLEALRAGRTVDEILIARGVRPNAVLDEIRRLADRRDVRIRDVGRRLIDELAETAAPQGVIARVGGFTYASLDDLLVAGDPLLLLALDGVTDPHNVGALARSLEAAGGHGMILPKRRAAPVTPTVEKAAAGALTWLRVAQVPNLPEALRRLQGAGVWVVALDAEGETALEGLTVATEPLCVVVGAEGRGVSRLVAERSDVRCRIPMAGRVGSLNASVAGGVALFEVARRRRGAHPPDGGGPHPPLEPGE
jgi:23S rRNA (guanosine2251-2'-O)-methyltransferase